jgi:uncharacterized protein (DUF1786 family)
MQVLSVDVGTGTQDVYLFRSGLGLENGFKLVIPSPTMIVRSRIQSATRRGERLLLTGVTMGGGPSHWAAEAHLRAGLPLYATPDAARTFNDDLDWVQREMRIQVVSEDEAAALPDTCRIALLDFDYPAIRAAFSAFGVDLAPDAVAVAVFDHGAAPPGISDRQFRFDYLASRLQADRSLPGFAFRAPDVPPAMTRMRAVVQSAASRPCPLVLMDTAPAGVLGATLDSRVAARPRVMVVNVGNFHTLAFRLGPTGVEGVMEHHTGLLNLPRLETLLEALANGSLTHAEVFGDQGHGALVLEPRPLNLAEGEFGVVVTGPRRGMMQPSRLRPHFAAPFGDMMIAGCFGLLAASARLLRHLADPILEALAGHIGDIPPWERTD